MALIHSNEFHVFTTSVLVPRSAEGCSLEMHHFLCPCRLGSFSFSSRVSLGSVYLIC